jgi:predicted RNase H-like HicB family nuclease
MKKTANVCSFSVYLKRAKRGGWVIECPALPGCASQGETEAEALENIADAIQTVLEVRKELRLPPYSTSKNRPAVRASRAGKRREVQVEVPI